LRRIDAAHDPRTQHDLRDQRHYLNTPVYDHFEAQVDVIMALANASDLELTVLKNAFANPEAFCKLLLRRHLQPDSG
jgi:hypothetical protein